MRMHLIVVRQPSWQLLDDRLSVRPGVHADIVAFEGSDERLMPFDRAVSLMRTRLYTMHLGL